VKEKTAPEVKRTALLIRCTEEEAARIREGARRERRTVSAYVLHAVMNRMRVQESLAPAPPLQPRKRNTAAGS
jgi:hypothetical protein